MRLVRPVNIVGGRLPELAALPYTNLAKNTTTTTTATTTSSTNKDTRDEKKPGNGILGPIGLGGFK